MFNSLLLDVCDVAAQYNTVQILAFKNSRSHNLSIEEAINNSIYLMKFVPNENSYVRIRFMRLYYKNYNQ